MKSRSTKRGRVRREPRPTGGRGSRSRKPVRARDVSGTFMTVERIYEVLEGEWVLLADPRVARSLEVEAGTVLHHSKDRDEVYRKALELKPKRSAILFTGEIPEGTAVVL